MIDFLTQSNGTEKPVPFRITALLLALCAILLSPTLSFRLGTDQGSYAYMAAELLNGHWPYIDTWDHQFPGGWILHALEIFVFGKSVWMFRVFDLIYQLTVVYFIFRITHRISDLPSAFFAAGLYCLIYQGYGPWNTAQREGYGFLFIIIGFWWFLTRRRRSPELTASGIGLGLGLAITFKPTLLALSGLYFPLILQFRREYLKTLVLAAIGVLLPTALLVLFYWSHGALQDMYEASIGFTSKVYIHQYGADQSPIGRWLHRVGQLGGTAKLLTAGYLPFLFIGAHRPIRGLLYTGYIGSVFAVLAQGTFAGYHYLPGLGIGAILIGTVFFDGTTILSNQLRLAPNRKSIFRAVSASVAIVLAALHYQDPESIDRLIHLRFLESPFPNEYRNATVFDFTESWDVAEYIHKRSLPEDRIQVWAHDSVIYYLAERRAASRFQSSIPLVVRVPGQPITEMQKHWRNEFMESMHRNPPRFITVAREDNWWWAPEQKTSWQLLDDFPEWKAFIFDHYSKVHEIGRFVIYRRQS